MMDVRLAATAYGEPVATRQLAPSTSRLVRGAGVPFTGHTRCLAKNESCQAHRVKGEDYCRGHLRQFEKNGWVD